MLIFCKKKKKKAYINYVLVEKNVILYYEKETI